ncbi:hypothetical protein ODJ79_14860 [Actinoplanes sp. KI2]|uniref:hypothetical protein n=1 Tax=Actinoplanes sp. KI2 TaxID=2983315 RepID=UPI0021D5C4B4|nr:hypothetical protein [Actinoplanes sp. KI2]MCU7725004.1 hypothetical protein [Actinoplanes sp. KI2]
MELRDRLDLIAGPAVRVSPADADADLARGRRALRRRRAALGTGASVFAVAAAAAVVVASTASAAKPQQPTARPAPATSAPAPGSASVKQARLVAYEGKQPAGFTIDKVPAGWEVQGVDATVLTIAPIGEKDRDPNSFVGKIAIGLQSADDHRTPKGTDVQVGGLHGVINEPEHAPAHVIPSGPGTGRPATIDDSQTKNLWVQQKNGVWLQVQIWDASGWTNAQIVEFGAGIHVLPGAKAAVG